MDEDSLFVAVIFLLVVIVLASMDSLDIEKFSNFIDSPFW